MSLLRLRDLRLVWMAAVVSWAGDALSFIAFMWLAYDVGGASGVVVVRLVDSVPSVIVGLVAGVVADRVDRRRLMISADLLRAAALLPLIAAGLGGRPTLLALAVSIFLIRVGDAFFEPASGALLPDLVPADRIQPANSLFHATSETLTAAATGAAGLLLALLPLEHFFTLDAASFLASAALLSMVAVRPVLPRREDVRPLAELTAGVSELARRPSLAVAMTMFGLGIVIGAGIFIPAAPSLVGGRLHDGPGSFGLVMVGFAVGAILASALLARTRVRNQAGVSVISWVGYAVCFGLFAAAGNLVPLVVGAAAAGAAEASARILLISTMQERIPSASLGRAMAVFFTVHRAGHGVGLITVAFLVTSLPLTVALIVGAGLELVSVAACLAALRLSGPDRIRATVHGR
jgi:MFS transporter, DHA3 family, macrolide efflux protein